MNETCKNNIERARALLEELGKEPEKARRPKENSLRQMVYNNHKKIKELMAEGWTREQICQKWRDRLGMSFSTSTFANYLSEAGRMAER